MKTIDIDDDLYQYIASNTQFIGESASDILRRLLVPAGAPLKVDASETADKSPQQAIEAESSHKTAMTDDLAGLINAEALEPYATVVEKFLFVLSTLAKLHAGNFASVLDIKGSDRLYFATSKESLLASGSSTNPKSIPDSEYWVVTNNNTNKKMTILKQVLANLGYSNQQVEHTIGQILPNKS